MNVEFGKNVYEQSLKLQEQGKDVNQLVKVLFDRDPEGHNYGIGIMLGGDGKPMKTSATLLKYVSAEIEQSLSGKYFNSNAVMEEMKKAVLQWQRIPEAHWDRFQLVLPSDAGTGSVKTALEMCMLLSPDTQAIGIQELGWPAYKQIARLARVGCQEFAVDSVIAEEKVLPVYQAGPMNTTGEVMSKELIEARAASAAKRGENIILDRAYSGFEFARLLAKASYDEVMRRSYELQIQPYIEQGVPFFLALSPTKVFVSFALRPCGMLLAYCPDPSQERDLTLSLNAAIRARGSSFEHLVTRAFVKAMIHDRADLEAEHGEALARTTTAEAAWKSLVKGTPIEYLYRDNYAGLFRNPKAREEAAIHLYNAHLYPVFANQRCRQNVTGIPDDVDLARQHVSVFAEQCY